MCGRYSLATPANNDLRSRFLLGESLEIRQRYNVAPGDDVVAVTTSKEGEPRGELLRWGLVPYWAKDEKSGYKMINARLETVLRRDGATCLWCGRSFGRLVGPTTLARQTPKFTVTVSTRR